jgi:transcriptional regulator with XRE-family HTH domain
MRDSRLPMTKKPLPPNQLVALNLARARRLRGWTQEQAAEKLAPSLGVHWSKATYSAAERSATGERRRLFDADDLLAFARAFELPIGWFLLPPHGSEPLLSTPDDPDGLPPTLILDWLYREEPDELERVRQLCAELGEEVTERQHALQEKARVYVASLAATAVAEYATVTPAGLRALADLLERAASDAADELRQA